MRGRSGEHLVCEQEVLTISMKKRIVDVCMTVLLLCLMAYQVTG
jgi:hypothetical protein